METNVCVCVCVTESFCCTLEANNIVNPLYLNLKTVEGWFPQKDLDLCWPHFTYLIPSLKIAIKMTTGLSNQIRKELFTSAVKYRTVIITL